MAWEIKKKKKKTKQTDIQYRRHGLNAQDMNNLQTLKNKLEVLATECYADEAQG